MFLCPFSAGIHFFLSILRVEAALSLAYLMGHWYFFLLLSGCTIPLFPWNLGKGLSYGLSYWFSGVIVSCSSSALQVATLSASSLCYPVKWEKDRQKTLLPCYFCHCKADLWLLGAADIDTPPKSKVCTWENPILIDCLGEQLCISNSAVTKFWKEVVFLRLLWRKQLLLNWELRSPEDVFVNAITCGTKLIICNDMKYLPKNAVTWD